MNSTCLNHADGAAIMACQASAPIWKFAAEFYCLIATTLSRATAGAQSCLVGPPVSLTGQSKMLRPTGLQTIVP
jgi:hypothetical protein